MPRLKQESRCTVEPVQASRPGRGLDGMARGDAAEHPDFARLLRSGRWVGMEERHSSDIHRQAVRRSIRCGLSAWPRQEMSLQGCRIGNQHSQTDLEGHRAETESRGFPGHRQRIDLLDLRTAEKLAFDSSTWEPPGPSHRLGHADAPWHQNWAFQVRRHRSSYPKSPSVHTKLGLADRVGGPLIPGQCHSPDGSAGVVACHRLYRDVGAYRPSDLGDNPCLGKALGRGTMADPA